MSDKLCPNLAARIYPTRPISARLTLQQSKEPTICDYHRRREIQFVSATTSDDLLSLGQTLLSAGSQTLEKLGRQFRPLPQGFPKGANLLAEWALPCSMLGEMSDLDGCLTSFLPINS